MNTRMLSLATAVAVLAVVPLGPVVHAAQQSETKPYVLGSWPHLWPQCYLNGSPMSPSWGGACFAPPTGVDTIGVTIDDDVATAAAGRILFTTGYDTEEVGPAFCGSIDDVAVPEGTLGINISTSPLRTDGACGPLSQAGSGTITLTYHS